MTQATASPEISLEHQSWFADIQARVSTLTKRFPVPQDVAAGMWQMVVIYAAHQPGGIAQLCLERGRVWGSQELRQDLPRGQMKMCFENAGMLWMEDESLTYVEGFACTSTVGLAVHHAWVVDADGKVLDPTWPNGVAYCGLPVQRQALRDILTTSRKWGIFDNPKTPAWVFSDFDRWIGDAPGRRPEASAPAS